MKKSRDRLRHLGHLPSFASFVQVLAKSRTLQGIAVPFEDVHIIANPLLDEGGEKCCCETEDEGHEPEDIHACVRCRWFKIGEWGGRGGRDGELRGNGEDLAGNLIEHGDILLKIIHHLI